MKKTIMAVIFLLLGMNMATAIAQDSQPNTLTVNTIDEAKVLLDAAFLVGADDGEPGTPKLPPISTQMANIDSRNSLTGVPQELVRFNPDQIMVGATPDNAIRLSDVLTARIENHNQREEHSYIWAHPYAILGASHILRYVLSKLTQTAGTIFTGIVAALSGAAVEAWLNDYEAGNEVRISISNGMTICLQRPQS